MFFRTVPPAITLVRWVNENAFVSEVQTRPCPTFGRPVHLGDGPHRLQPGTSPHALRIPPYGGHPALRSTASSGSRSVLAVSSFRFRARLARTSELPTNRPQCGGDGARNPEWGPFSSRSLIKQRNQVFTLLGERVYPAQSTCDRIGATHCHTERGTCLLSPR